MPATTRARSLSASTPSAARPAEGSGATRCPHCTDGLGRPKELRPGSWRARVHANAALARGWRAGVFVVGLLLVALGIALAVLPGPLTIPPVLLGVWVWSTEFAWAQRIFTVFRARAQDAWRHAKQHPVSSVVVTVGGLVAVGVVVWAVRHFDLIARLKDVVGL